MEGGRERRGEDGPPKWLAGSAYAPLLLSFQKIIENFCGIRKMEESRKNKL